MFLSVPFSAKELPDGRKLYRRAHGYTVDLVANDESTLYITVPYNVCKINKAEIIGSPEGVKIDLKVLDTSSGTFSGVPNYILNQFAFDVNVAKDYYEDFSPYDADLYLGMQILVVLKNSTDSTKTVGINIPFHEVV